MLSGIENFNFFVSDHLNPFSRKVVELLDDEINKEDILIAAKENKK